MTDLARPIFFAEVSSDQDADKYIQVSLCVRKHRGEAEYHFLNSYTYVVNGAHIDRVQDGIIAIHYVDTFDRLREIAPDHWLLPENTDMLDNPSDFDVAE